MSFINVLIQKKRALFSSTLLMQDFYEIYLCFNKKLEDNIILVHNCNIIEKDMFICDFSLNVLENII
ncbi:hypothetical protein CFB3_07180 [Clostridium folliculivorans]|uniref:Uncharacterized protein n=1 Tax=Clostridium folliculivorans TaxID=2886038 RepID=A0A9W6DAP7_9CLOT|nr:hypothetical protein CFOLD11_24160 [Clostridium folliculivorans]GKU28612.1 hypothetical protein CFB3_07180 [Clostridium folliculivorans]